MTEQKKKKWWIQWDAEDAYSVQELTWELNPFPWGTKLYTNYWDAWAACCKCQGKDWADPIVQRLRGIPEKGN